MDWLNVGEAKDDLAVLSVMLNVYPPTAGIYAQTHALFPSPDLEFRLIPGLNAFPNWGWLQIIISKFPHCWACRLFLIFHNYISATINIHPIAQVLNKFLEQNLGMCLRVSPG